MNYLIYIAIVNVLLAFKLWNDRRLHLHPDKRVNHPLSAIIDGVIYVVSAYFLFCDCSLMWFAGLIGATLGYRWILFDVLFNWLNSWPWDYYGKTSRLDRFMFILGKWHLVPKIALLLGGVLMTLL